MSGEPYEDEAADIVRRVKTWRTWRKDYDEQAAYDAVLRLVSFSCPVPSVIYAKGMNREERERIHRVRYALGVYAIEAAKGDNLETTLTEVAAELEPSLKGKYDELARNLRVFLNMR